MDGAATRTNTVGYARPPQPPGPTKLAMPSNPSGPASGPPLSP